MLLISWCTPITFIIMSIYKYFVVKEPEDIGNIQQCHWKFETAKWLKSNRKLDKQL